MPRDEIARGVAITTNIDEDRAKAMVAQLDQDILTCMKHIRSTTRGMIELDKEKARSATTPMEDVHLNPCGIWHATPLKKGSRTARSTNPKPKKPLVANGDSAHG